MEINFNEIKKNVKVNGITFHRTDNKQTYNYLVTAIGLYRMRHTTTEIMEKLKALNHAGYDEYAAGRRFRDDETVATRLISAINNAFAVAGADVQSKECIKMVDVFVQGLSGTELDAFILESLRDSASSDHWYMYEKQWD